MTYLLPRHGLLVGVLILALALPFVTPTYYAQFAAKVMLVGLAAMALNLVVGFGGLVSMCHAAFFGLAGYALALLSDKYDPASLPLTLAAAIGIAMAAALVIGALSLRTKGIYFIMVTLAFGEMLFFLFHDTTIGGGSDGAFVYFKPELILFGWKPFDLERVTHFYFICLALVVAGAVLLNELVQSPFGRALAAARDSERRARALGFPVYRIRLTAYAISGALTGVSGYFAAAQHGFVAPQVLGWHFSALLLVMVVLGGTKSVIGPLAGALLLMGLEETLRGLTEHWKLIEGLIVIALVLLIPGGLQQIFGFLAERPDPIDTVRWPTHD